MDRIRSRNLSNAANDEGNSKLIALVTGASRGLGAAISIELARRRVHVIGLARNSGALQEVDDKIRSENGSMTIVQADITDSDALSGIFGSIENRWGRIDVFVHAAIYAPPLSPAAHGDPRELRLSVETNIVATASLIGQSNALLRASRDGVAVFLEDDRAGDKFFGAYGCTKAAQTALARSWKRESKKIGPRVEILAPRPMRTRTRKRFFPGESGTRLANPEDEAKRLVILFFR